MNYFWLRMHEARLAMCVRVSCRERVTREGVGSEVAHRAPTSFAREGERALQSMSCGSSPRRASDLVVNHIFL